MIVLMNYALPLIILVGAFLSFRFKSYKPAVIAIVIAFIYMVAQPSYLPKGTVPAPVIQELEYIDKPIVDRSRKVMSDEERDAARNEKLKQINESIESKIKEKDNG